MIISAHVRKYIFLICSMNVFGVLQGCELEFDKDIHVGMEKIQEQLVVIGGLRQVIDELKKQNQKLLQAVHSLLATCTIYQEARDQETLLRGVVKDRCMIYGAFTLLLHLKPILTYRKFVTIDRQQLQDFRQLELDVQDVRTQIVRSGDAQALVRSADFEEKIKKLRQRYARHTTSILESMLSASKHPSMQSKVVRAAVHALAFASPLLLSYARYEATQRKHPSLAKILHRSEQFSQLVVTVAQSSDLWVDAAAKKIGAQLDALEMLLEKKPVAKDLLS